MIQLICTFVNRKCRSRLDAAFAFVSLLLITIATFCPQSAAFEETKQQRLQYQLQQAIKHSNVEQIKALVHQGAQINPVGGYSALMMLCNAGQAFDRRIADLLVTMGVNVNAQDDGETALDIGCSQVSDKTLVPMVKWFLAHDAHADGYEDSRPINALTMRFHSGLSLKYEADAAELLIAHGARVNVEDINGSNPLVNTCTAYVDDQPAFICLPDLAHLFIKHGADVNRPNQDDTTPLMGLAEMQDDWYPEAMGIARDLLAHGARIDLKNKHGRTALQLARENHFAALAELIRAYEQNARKSKRPANR